MSGSSRTILTQHYRPNYILHPLRPHLSAQPSSTLSRQGGTRRTQPKQANSAPSNNNNPRNLCTHTLDFQQTQAGPAKPSQREEEPSLSPDAPFPTYGNQNTQPENPLAACEGKSANSASRSCARHDSQVTPLKMNQARSNNKRPHSYYDAHQSSNPHQHQHQPNPLNQQPRQRRFTTGEQHHQILQAAYSSRAESSSSLAASQPVETNSNKLIKLDLGSSRTDQLKSSHGHQRDLAKSTRASLPAATGAAATRFQADADKLSSWPIFVVLEGYRVAAYSIGGEPYICLPKLLRFLRKKFTIQRMVSKFEDSMIDFTSATQAQVDGFKWTKALPSSAKSCPLIKRSDADRICLELFEQYFRKKKRNDLIDMDKSSSNESFKETTRQALDANSRIEISNQTCSSSPPDTQNIDTKATTNSEGPVFESNEIENSILALSKSVSSTLMILVYHRCFGKCRGFFYPSHLMSSKSQCIECTTCHAMLSPRRFIGHTHGQKENNVCHWGFDSYNWRRYIRLSRKQNVNELDEEELLTQFNLLVSKSADIFRKNEKHQDSVGDMNDDDDDFYEFDQSDGLESDDINEKEPVDLSESDRNFLDKIQQQCNNISQPYEYSSLKQQQQQSVSFNRRDNGDKLSHQDAFAAAMMAANLQSAAPLRTGEYFAANSTAAILGNCMQPSRDASITIPSLSISSQMLNASLNGSQKGFQSLSLSDYEMMKADSARLALDAAANFPIDLMGNNLTSDRRLRLPTHLLNSIDLMYSSNSSNDHRNSIHATNQNMAHLQHQANQPGLCNQWTSMRSVPTPTSYDFQLNQELQLAAQNSLETTIKRELFISSSLNTYLIELGLSSTLSSDVVEYTLNLVRKSSLLF